MNLLKSLVNRVAAISMTVLLSVGILSAAPAMADTTVKMGTDSFTMAFEPAQVAVAPGDTIHFVSNHMGPHNVVFEGDLAAVSHSALEMDGQSFDVTIPDGTAAGDYTFYCEPHRGANMVGTVKVAG